MQVVMLQQHTNDIVQTHSVPSFVAKAAQNSQIAYHVLHAVHAAMLTSMEQLASQIR